MIVDSHCHLDRLHFKRGSANLDDALNQARRRGISGFLCVCIDLDNAAAVLDIAHQHPDVWASAGIHPCSVNDHTTTVDDLIERGRDPRIIAFGETGLDYHYQSDNARLQQEQFAAHLQAGKASGKAVIVHTREARQDTLDLIRSEGCRDASGVLHCFTESWDMARQALDMNYYISLSGIVTFKNAEALRDVARQVPADRLLVETDSPYLAPVPYRGKPNEPQYVREVAAFVADLRGVNLEQLAEQTTANFERLFKVQVARHSTLGEHA